VDLTNATVQGPSRSDRRLHKGPLSAVKSAEGRVAVAVWHNISPPLAYLAAVAPDEDCAAIWALGGRG